MLTNGVAILAALVTVASLVAWKTKHLPRYGAAGACVAALGLAYLGGVGVAWYLAPLAGIAWITGFARWSWKRIWAKVTAPREVTGPERQHLNADGRPKKVYATFAEAQAIADRQAAQEGGSTAHAYQCGICRSFHVGHTKR